MRDSENEPARALPRRRGPNRLRRRLPGWQLLGAKLLVGPRVANRRGLRLSHASHRRRRMPRQRPYLLRGQPGRGAGHDRTTICVRGWTATIRPRASYTTT